MHQNGQVNKHAGLPAQRIVSSDLASNAVNRCIPFYYHPNSSCFSNFTFYFLVPALEPLNKLRSCSSTDSVTFICISYISLKDKFNTLAYNSQQSSTTSPMLFIVLRTLPKVLEIHFEEKRLSNQIGFHKKVGNKKSKGDYLNHQQSELTPFGPGEFKCSTIPSFSSI